MKIRKVLEAAALTLLLTATSCTGIQDITYMQDAVYGREEIVTESRPIRVQPHDKISIVVSCKEPELARLFNLVQTTNLVGQDGEQKSQSQGHVSVYTVDDKGDIEFPVLGKVHIAGLTRDEISGKLSEELIKGKWVSDPVVTVEYANLHFSVVGEVKAPGTYAITNDRITLLEAISRAGDLTPYGEREVTVIREKDGKRIKYLVDLRDNSMFESPAYYLQQNDVVYVKPNGAIARQAADNPNNLKSIALWTSIASLLTTVAVLVFK